MGKEGATRPDERFHLVLNRAYLSPCRFDDLVAFGLGFTKDELCLLVRLLANVPTQLLRGDQCFVERLVALTKGTELFVEPFRLVLQFLALLEEVLHLGGDLVAELVDARLVVATQRGAEVIPPDIQRSQMKGFVFHGVLAPNRIVPRRTIVAPSSTAIS